MSRPRGRRTREFAWDRGRRGVKDVGDEDEHEFYVLGGPMDLVGDPAAAERYMGDAGLLPCPTDPSLLLDRFDCRLLLPENPSRHEATKERRRQWGAAGQPGAEAEAEALAEAERYRGLPSEEEQEAAELPILHSLPAGFGLWEGEAEAAPARGGGEEDHGRHPDDRAGAAIPFDYGPPRYEVAEPEPPPPPPPRQEDLFVPPYPVPDHLRHCLPESEKHNSVIMSTARFVRTHGLQAELKIQSQQGANPNFWFLRQSDRVYPYYRWVLETDPVYPEDYVPPPRPVRPGSEAAAAAAAAEEEGDGEEDGEEMEEEKPMHHGPFQPLVPFYSSEEDESEEAGSEEAGRGGEEEEEKPLGPKQEPDSEGGEGEVGPGAATAAGPVPVKAEEDDGADGGVSLQPSSDNKDGEDAAVAVEGPAFPSGVQLNLSLGAKAAPAAAPAAAAAAAAADASLPPQRPPSPPPAEPPEADRAVIERLVAFLARGGGTAFVEGARTREKDNPLFAFLFPGGPHHAYFKWRCVEALGEDDVDELFPGYIAEKRAIAAAAAAVAAKIKAEEEARAAKIKATRLVPNRRFVLPAKPAAKAEPAAATDATGAKPDASTEEPKPAVEAAARSGPDAGPSSAAVSHPVETEDPKTVRLRRARALMGSRITERAAVEHQMRANIVAGLRAAFVDGGDDDAAGFEDGAEVGTDSGPSKQPTPPLSLAPAIPSILDIVRPSVLPAVRTTAGVTQAAEDRSRAAAVHALRAAFGDDEPAADEGTTEGKGAMGGALEAAVAPVRASGSGINGKEPRGPVAQPGAAAADPAVKDPPERPRSAAGGLPLAPDSALNAMFGLGSDGMVAPAATSAPALSLEAAVAEALREQQQREAAAAAAAAAARAGSEGRGRKRSRSPSESSSGSDSSRSRSRSPSNSRLRSHSRSRSRSRRSRRESRRSRRSGKRRRSRTRSRSRDRDKGRSKDRKKSSKSSRRRSRSRSRDRSRDRRRR